MSESNVYTIWVKLTNGEHRRLKSFNDETLAEKFLEYADYFFELEPDSEVVDLFIKEEGDPVYQIYFLDPEGNPQLEDDDLYFNLEEVMTELQNLSENNPYTQYDYQEIDIDEQTDEYLDIPTL